MEKHLVPSLDKNKRKILVICGLGGIGKTQLAVEYARTHKDAYTSVLWLNGETEESLIQDLACTAFRLPNGQVRNLGKEVNSAEKLREEAGMTLDWLTTEGNRNWLLILDNIDNTVSWDSPEKDMKGSNCYDIMSYFPTCDMGSIIITTRLQSLKVLGDSIHLEKVNDSSGLKMLESYSGRSLKTESQHRSTIDSVTKIEDYVPGQSHSLSYRSGT